MSSRYENIVFGAVSLLKRSLRDKGGQIAVSMALAAPVLMGVAGLAIDYASMTRQHANLQAIADGAAIAAAREFALSNASDGQVKEIADQYTKRNSKGFSEGITASVTTQANAGAVTVSLSHPWRPIFAHFFNADVTPVVAVAKANLVGTGKVCAIALKPSANKALHILQNATLIANDCGVFSNSSHKNSIWIDQNGSIQAGMICASGGTKLKKPALVSPPITTDCPPVPDPLKDRAAPPSDTCSTFKTKVISDEVVTLWPGTYCGGLKIEGDSRINLSPGIYVMSGGGLQITDKAVVKGFGVGFYFTGKKVGMKFEGATSIHLEAPETGPMAGILLFEDRNAPTGSKYEIASDDARTLLGTIYLPNGTLRVSANSPVADQSAYTAIVAYMLDLDEGPDLVLNSDYDATDVPAPAGLKGGKIVLTR